MLHRLTPRWSGPDLLDRLIDLAITAGLIVLILVGFLTSYRTLYDLAATSGGYPIWLAPAVPLSFDLGIVVLSLKVARAAREGRTAPLLRLLVAALSTATVLANVSAAATPTARLLHAVPPAMFVICFESVVITARRRALTRHGLLPQPLPRLRLARWVLAPRSTWTAWRDLVLDRTTEAGGKPRPAAPPSAPHPSAPVGASPDDRARVVQEVVSADPTITSRQLMTHLATKGHTISLRTAQRLRSGGMAR